MAVIIKNLMRKDFRILREEIKEEVRGGKERYGDMIRWKKI